MTFKETIYNDLLMAASQLGQLEGGADGLPYGIYHGAAAADEVLKSVAYTLKYYEIHELSYEGSAPLLKELASLFNAFEHLDHLFVGYTYGASMNFFRSHFASKSNASVTLNLELKLDNVLQRKPNAEAEFIEAAKATQNHFVSLDATTVNPPYPASRPEIDFNGYIVLVNEALAELDQAMDQIWITGALEDKEWA
jgi:hypothetical protein